MEPSSNLIRARSYLIPPVRGLSDVDLALCGFDLALWLLDLALCGFDLTLWLFDLALCGFDLT